MEKDIMAKTNKQNQAIAGYAFKHVAKEYSPDLSSEQLQALDKELDGYFLKYGRDLD